MKEKTNLYKELQMYAESDFYPYHIPGHKRRRLGDIPGEILGMDLTEIEGFDDLHHPEGILRRLQERANDLYGAEETFCLINGSTCGILSAISAALPRGGRILMARASHKSAYHAAYLRDLKIAYLYSERREGFDLLEAVAPAEVERALEQNPDVGAVFLVSPTYEGRIADIRAIAEIVHKRGIALIVDEAHGSHLGFAEGYAAGSCAQGADLVIHSTHKTLPAMTQTALLHVNGSLIDRERLKRFLHIYQSSSPSYILMASVEDAMEIVEKEGEERFAFLREQCKALWERLQACRSLRFVPWQDVEEGRQDIGKLAIFAGNSGVSGKWIYDTLREKYHLQCEMAGERFCLAVFTIADGEEAYERMGDALLEIDSRIDGWPADNEASEDPAAAQEDGFVRPVEVVPLARAWDMPWERAELSRAIDRPVADFVNLYPPGVPLLAPGERFTQEMYAQILRFREQGLNLQGVEEQDGAAWIRVLKDGGIG